MGQKRVDIFCVFVLLLKEKQMVRTGDTRGEKRGEVAKDNLEGPTIVQVHRTKGSNGEQHRSKEIFSGNCCSPSSNSTWE